MKLRLFLAASLLLAGAAPATAQDGSALTIKTELEKLMPGADGAAPAKTYVDPGTVVPGDRIRYTLTFHNKGARPAAGVNLVDPIPDGILFEESADPEGFAFSVDGGKSFGPLATATVASDGAVRAATPADVTHVRWQLAAPVPAGGSHSVAFFGRVR